MRGWVTKLLGDRGERAAARYLRRQGFEILARQQAGRLGEIDLIARDGDTIVFVEVKTRTSGAAGNPVEAVTPAKQRQMTRIALAWLKQRGLLECRARFDVVALLWAEGARQPEIKHYRHAFEAAGVEGLYS
jgi:putative endonuclease